LKDAGITGAGQLAECGITQRCHGLLKIGSVESVERFQAQFTRAAFPEGSMLNSAVDVTVNLLEALYGAASVNGGAVLSQREARIIQGRILIVVPHQVRTLGAHVGNALSRAGEELMLQGKIPVLRVAGYPFAGQHIALKRRRIRAVCIEARNRKQVQVLAAGVGLIQLSITIPTAIAKYVNSFRCVIFSRP
jgi:hypothetical protein